MARRQQNAFISSAAMAIIMSVFMFIIAMYSGAAFSTGIGLSLGMMLFSVILSTISYLYMENRQRQALTGKKGVSRSADSRQERTIEIDLPFAQAFDLAQSALERLDNQAIPAEASRMMHLLPRTQRLKIHKLDPDMGTMSAGLRTKVFGITDPMEFTRLNVHLMPLDENSTRIRIVSEATFMDSFDMGKNHHYVTSLSRYIRRESYHQTVADRLTATDEQSVADSLPDETALISRGMKN